MNQISIFKYFFAIKIKLIVGVIAIFCFNFIGLSQSTLGIQNKLADEIQSLASKEKLHLAYESGLLQNKFCNINLKGIPFKKALNLLLSQTDLEYILTEDSQLLIRKKEKDNHKSLKLIGQIKDKISKEEVSFATIFLLGSTVGSYSDEHGYFDLIIPEDYIKGNDTIIIHRIGYKDRRIDLNLFINNTDIELEVKTRILPIITILRPIKSFDFSNSFLRHYFDNKQFIFREGITDNILRKVQYLPSIYANKDNSSNIFIRGGKAYETLVLVDGLRIYNPTHFYNVFSSINSDFIKDVNVYKSTIPPSIRSMTGGVVEMFSNKVEKSFSADINANLMYLSATARIPLSKKLGVNLAARTSVYENTRKSFLGEIISKNNPILQDKNLLNSRNDKKNPGFTFYDFNTALSYKINKKQKLKLCFYNSSDSYDDRYLITLKKKENSKSIIGLKYRNISKWSNQSIGLNYSLKWHKVDTEISLSSAKYKESNRLNINIKRQRSDSVTINSIFDFMSSSIQDAVFKIDNKIKLSGENHVLMGINFTNYGVLSKVSVNKSTILNIKNNSNSYTVYGGYSGIVKNISFGVSAKSTYYQSTKTNYLDPSVNIGYNISKNIVMFSSINKQHQYLRQFEYETPQSKNTYFWALANNTTPILSSTNISLGGKLNFTNSKIIIETYYKSVNGLSTLLRSNPADRNIFPPSKENYRVFFGDSYNYGIDFFWLLNIRYYSSQLSYTYSIFNQRFEQVFKNRYHPAPTDTRHQIKWLNSYTWNNWQLGLNFVYSSGTPYFDFSKLKQESPRSKILFENFIEYLPDYFRTDISIKYLFHFIKKDASLGLTIFNLTNRINVSERRIIDTDRGFNPKNTPFLVRSQTNLLSRTINLGIKIKI